MKGKNLYLTATAMLFAGIVLIIAANSLASFRIVTGGGILFIVAGVANVLIFTGKRNGNVRGGTLGTAVGWTASAAAVALGLCMLLSRDSFVPLVSVMLAVVLLFIALFQICLLTFGSRPVRINPWFFVVPMLLFGAAVFVYLQKPGDPHTDSSIVYVTGGAFALCGLASFAEGAIITSANRKLRSTIPELQDDPEAGDNAINYEPSALSAGSATKSHDPEDAITNN